MKRNVTYIHNVDLDHHASCGSNRGVAHRPDLVLKQWLDMIQICRHRLTDERRDVFYSVSGIKMMISVVSIHTRCQN